MHQSTMTALEFPRIQQELAAHAACNLGRELALAIAPLPDIPAIARVSRETAEAKSLLISGRTAPFGGIADIRRPVERAWNGGVLRPDELTAVADTIYGCRHLYRFLTEQRASARPGDPAGFPLLSRHAEAFGKFDPLEAEIRRCIDRGSVDSAASKALKQTRSEIATLEGRIQDRLAGLLRQYRNHLQEALVTSRNGRYVIPVKASSRSAVPGIVHGASASGSTLFIEPDALSQLSQELETWRAMEAAEVEQVLISLSAQVAQQAERLAATLEAVAQLDLVFARAKLSQAWDARAVTLNDAGLVDLKEARHPLLGKGAVGNRIRLTMESRMLIVTGPNTGGKTLLLKTLGLLVIIARCGLHLPVAEGSTLCFFADVRADIGDHQSLEQSLSTFSGHIATIAPMLKEAGPDTLVLLDELGSGTDPHEGTGLGIALLEGFQKRGAYVLVTTHLREIKEFGRKTPGCAYAGMGFDGETLRPTYHLIYGALGESRGLDIAARAGLPAEIVARARELVYGSVQPGQDAVETAPPQGALEAAGAGAPAPPEPPAHAGHPELDAPALDGPTFDGPPAARPVAPPATALVLATGSPGRCPVWVDGSVRTVSLPEQLRRAALVPGDRLRLWNKEPVDLLERERFLVSRDADTMAETPVAANLDRLLILISARQPDFAAPVLARHLLYAERHGVKPVICLTKADLVPPSVATEWLRPLRRSGYQAVAVSAMKQKGLEELRRMLDGQVAGVIGLPRAGKTTLLERFAAGPAVGTAIPLAEGGWLVDLPGLRELGVWKPDLTGAFQEFDSYVGRCGRPGCLHGQEPGCAVREAVEEGQLPRERYERYRLLLGQMRLA